MLVTQQEANAEAVFQFLIKSEARIFQKLIKKIGARKWARQPAPD
ncbi:unnamed protein product, partial [Pylaiella littoralis]